MAYRCHECKRRGRVPAVLMMPGLCTECGTDARTEEASQRLARAVDSIHPERRWARLDSDLMAERLDPLSWRLTIGGETACNGDGYASLRDVVPLIVDMPRLVITGTDGDRGENSGAGKTSFAVALMFDMLDAAKRMIMGGKDPSMGGKDYSQQAEGARFVATIDMADPDVSRLANGVPFAVIDDAGQEGRGGGFKAQEALMVTGNCLDRRERDKRKRTIVTTYGNRDDWGAWYGGRIVRLYWDMPSSAVLEMRREA